jgi:4-oxalocrotonate tautomerase
MPVITVDIHKVGSEQKSGLIRKLTEAAADVTKVPGQAFIVLVNELEDSNIGIGGKDRAEAMKAR